VTRAPKRRLNARLDVTSFGRRAASWTAPPVCRGRIRSAGGVGAQVFTREAVTLMHERSRGIPRTISVIADNALLTGFAVAQRPVNSATVREVCEDFDLGSAGRGSQAPAIAEDTLQSDASLFVMKPTAPPVDAPPPKEELADASGETLRKFLFLKG